MMKKRTRGNERRARAPKSQSTRIQVKWGTELCHHISGGKPFQKDRVSSDLAMSYKHVHCVRGQWQECGWRTASKRTNDKCRNQKLNCLCLRQSLEWCFDSLVRNHGRVLSGRVAGLILRDQPFCSMESVGGRKGTEGSSEECDVQARAKAGDMG